MTERELEPVDAYRRALERFAAYIDYMHELVHDPFKAPEITVFESKPLLDRIWDLQIEFAAMERSGKRERA